MAEIRFDNGNIVTIRDGFVQAPPPELTAIIDGLAATLPGYGSTPSILDEDFNIAQESSVLQALERSCAAIRCRP